MCTSFVYRKENILVGMNFDNNGRDFKISGCCGHDFLVSVKIGSSFFPSFGVSAHGMFVNDLMVDSDGAAPYKRQNKHRWVTGGVIKHVMESAGGMGDVREVLSRIEVVNGPFMSTHNLIVDPLGNTCVVEPGRNNIFSGVSDSDIYIMTNFPLSNYLEWVPPNPVGSGADRFCRAAEHLSKQQGVMSIDQGFRLLKSVKQDGPEWVTQLSLIYDPTAMELFYCLGRHFDSVQKFDFASNKIQVIRYL